MRHASAGVPLSGRRAAHAVLLGLALLLAACGGGGDDDERSTNGWFGSAGLQRSAPAGPSDAPGPASSPP